MGCHARLVTERTAKDPICLKNGHTWFVRSLFLIYINISNCSEKLSFRTFADDTNIFAPSSNLRDLENLVNNELFRVTDWCNANQLSINTSKINYMIIKSQNIRLTKT